MTRIFVVAAWGAMLPGLLAGAQRGRKQARRPAASRELKVKPSPAIEERVRQEIAKADGILAYLDGANMLESPYVISALYYRDGFLTRYPEDKGDADPARRIIAHIARAFTAELKAGFIRDLHGLYDQRADGAGPPVAPVPLPPPAKRRTRRTHPNAVDLFAPEGTAVRAVAGGVVLLAENGWTPGTPFSTSSQAGGNTVIVFDPATDKFYRYCHLESVEVAVGTLVAAGARVGRVGHTGLNASRRGHGRHLHLEINSYDGETIHPLSYKQIWAVLAQAD